MAKRSKIAAAVVRRGFGYSASEAFAPILHQLGATLFVTTYQAGKVIVVRAAGDELAILLRSFDRAMGMAVDPRRLALGTRNQVWLFDRVASAPYRARHGQQHDAVFAPRSGHITGHIDGHELAWVKDQLWMVNTRFSCLCTIDHRHSFVPQWRPAFITALAPEDRCHLNGMAVAADHIRYATALGAADESEGWRKHRLRAGVLIDVGSGEVVVEGLCMPHSPRLADSGLWLLNSGRGELLLITADQPQSLQVVCELPGYTRGLAVAGHYALVGLSRVRASRTFEGLPLQQRVDSPRCGVWIIDTRSGQTVAQLEFLSGLSEIFDVQLLRDVRFPTLIGLQGNAIDRSFSLPE